MTAIVMCADARALPLADESVDLIVTSPPYYGLRSYTNGGRHYDGQIGAEPTPAAYIDALIEATRDWLRVLKPVGSLWVNLGDAYVGGGRGGNLGGHLTGGSHTKTASTPHGTSKYPAKTLLGLPWRYAIRCLDDLGLILRAEVIWSKPNAMPESMTDRVRRSHETWLHFVQHQRYFAAIDGIREPASNYSRPNGAGRQARGGQKPRKMLDTCNPLGRLPGSVWEIATQPLHIPAELNITHHAAFPLEWPRRLIIAWCPPSGTVLDPFGGTGTTALVADVLGRTGISVDASADYCRLARWRTTDPNERARARRAPRPPQQLPGQMPLFELEDAK
ncbi:DNA-methyltransferase [Stackebrandtia nassauensis]|uniref:Methyltransferase n=1 Tax=Stackebrandtia nassauensis (strain DSM 44728 / CIP 108903 / NRRL B-16338 / NBRC 102104 / LLR-40K-21) TaxID=446470 RepID=D3Q404_STANL|nr:site-specific DNA-methyltransferase [Stackebrandtia nassauensis]ADD45889.1 DNA methylase N-4/N-6 domain protein [Stackebrandtia nassauensis DSM 44728]